MLVRRTLVAVLAMLALVVGACGGDDSGTDNDAISVDDATVPPPAGPAVPGATTSTTTRGRQTPAPWPAPTRNVSALIRAAGLPALPTEMLEYHIHSHLDVFVDGKSQTVPTDLGIDRAAGVLSPLHTHDDTGLIHVENDEETEFYLGQLFIEWDVRLDRECVGSYCRASTPIKYYVDGEEYTGDPARILFEHHNEIAIVIGTPPAKIPRDYEFPENT
jgi:hypothetical protein